MNNKLILNKIREAYNFKNDTSFAEFLGITPQKLSNWKSRDGFDVFLIYRKCEKLNAEFLLTGEGEVKKTENHSPQKQNMLEDQKTTNIFRLKTDRNISVQTVPLYNIEASAGMVGLFNSQSNSVEPIDYISIPNLPKCDGALYVTGDSMYPLLKSGDIIMYKQIHNKMDGIFYGEMYLISIDVDGEEFVSVKWVHKSDKGEEYIRIVSENRHHQPKDILLDKIRAIALVKASIRMNSMM